MSESSPNNERINRALDGDLTPEELASLKMAVVKDPKVRAEYVEQVWMHATLRAERESLGSLLDTPAPEPQFRKWWVPLLSAAAAACITLVVSRFLLTPPVVIPEPVRPMATLVKVQHCKWGSSDLPTKEQSKLGAGVLVLLEGMATLKYENGTTLFLEAPTTIRLIDDTRCRVMEGSVVAEIPPTARGFTIYTPELKAMDRGSRFGVTVGSLKTSHVYAFDGIVDVQQLGSREIRQLTKGKAYIVGMDNVALAAIVPEPVRLDQMYQAERWLSIPTSFRLGKDAYVQKGGKEPNGLHSLLMAKHTDVKNAPNKENAQGNERRIYLTFDVSQLSYVDISEEFHIGPDNISEAQLVLDPRPSGFGFAALVPDCTFAVYGITDQSLDYWKENSLMWGNAPANTDTGLIPNKTRKLAEFIMPRGGSSDLITIKSEALARFIREDTNGLVSFVVIRETSENEHQGMAHAFASKEHPQGKPPTLRVR